MNKTELAEAVAEKTGLSKSAARVALDAAFETISKTMCDGEPVRITGFGTFGPKARRGGTRRNPQTGQRMTVGPHVVASFRPSSDLKDTIRKKLRVIGADDNLSIVKAVR